MKEPERLTINKLLSSDSKYIIPIYQRNYAWGEKEIEQLLQDIIDKSANKSSNYYLGTLIVDEKIKENSTFYEIIDGQQRHTTLTLINAFFNSEKTERNLLYEARPEVEQYLDSIFRNADKTYHKEASNATKSLKEGLEIISKFFNSGIDLKGEPINKASFLTYFENNTFIIRVNVPKETDINHYFEIMNTRGVQLEKHQILKAYFIQKIHNNKPVSILFGKIWDACSNMDKYIQYCFDANLRKEIFGENARNNPKNIEDIKFEIKEENTETDSNKNQQEKTLINILTNFEKKKTKPLENNYIEGKYSSIIDFPNFLLQVLKVSYPSKDVSLDDKNILSSFGYGTDALPDPIDFINSLLKYRTLFDKYFIKREINNDGENNWVLKNPSNNENDYLSNTFEQEENDRLKMIQSMFHVSFPTNSYKNWLSDSLAFFKENTIDNNSSDFYNILCKIAQKTYSKNTNWEFNGVGISNFIFNYLDFLLWLNKEDLEISDESRKKFNSFKFTQRNSVEHIFAQNNIEGIEGNSKIETLNSFGNLCLINRGSNSKYSDYNFDAKKQQFIDRKNVESLKQVLIFEFKSWNTEQIEKHHAMMLEILNNLQPHKKYFIEI